VIGELNWNPRSPVNAQEAIELLTKVSFFWRDEITPLVPRDSLFLAAYVTLTPNAPASPVVRLRGSVVVDGNVLLWSAQEEDLKIVSGTIFEVASFLQFDIDCNQFVGPSGKPISSSTAPLYGGDGPFVPGGILRVAMVIVPDGAPITFMRRPFVGGAVMPVLPGVVLEPVVIG
jgi:hypothetical protein